ncbi:hypothetical protein [Segatella sp.]|uniref:hypothetical protein n=1 Tax=Segatella sp. TaxID=2974253 RepID=UPI003AAB08E8
MAEISITTKLEELKVLFNQMKEVYYVSKVNSDLATLAAFDMELPVLSDGVTFDTGAADVSKIKLTTGATWTSIANAGDSDIQFQVPSTGQYTLDEFVAKLKDYAEKLASSISKSGNSYQETYMSQAEQEAYVAESLNRALDELEAHKKNGTKPMDARELLRRLREEEA